jgi:RNA polymerase sigma-54 factor
MAFELKQNLKLTQQLIMTPQLQQAIKLLQLTRLELTDTISQELEENPFLEEEPAEEEIDVEGADEPCELTMADSEEGKAAEHTEELTGEGDGKSDFDWDNYLEDYGTVGVTYERQDAERTSWENLLTAKPSLTDYLMWQLKLSRFTELEMRIGEQIIGNLDQNGYLASTLEEIATVTGGDIQAVTDVLKKIQDFDPPGIAARDLKECLLIQARMFGPSSALIEAIIQDHMKELERKNYQLIAKKLKVDISAIQKAVTIICNMDPKPGSAYNQEGAQAIIPDVFVYKVGDEYRIVLNEDGIPRLRISNFYKEIMGGISGRHGEESGKKYIREKVQSATWLIKSIQQRQRTIYKVAESIVRYQRDFFDHGMSYIKPMILRDVSDDVGMHESTISRVVTGKYMHSPRGIFELKFFFGSSVHGTNGDVVASKSVKEEIRRMVSEENPKKPLSDKDIVKKLEASGVAVARRTVAKYREILGILPSSYRRKVF